MSKIKSAHSDTKEERESMLVQVNQNGSSIRKDINTTASLNRSDHKMEKSQELVSLISALHHGRASALHNLIEIKY